MDNNEDTIKEPSKEDLDNIQKERWKKQLTNPGVIQDKNKLDVRNAQDFYSLKAKNNLLGYDEYDTSKVDKIQKEAGLAADVAYDFAKYSLFPYGTGIYDRALIRAARALDRGVPGRGFLILDSMNRNLPISIFPDLDAKKETYIERRRAHLRKIIFGLEGVSDGLYGSQDNYIEKQEKNIVMKLFPQYKEDLAKMSPEAIRAFARLHQNEIREVLKAQYPELNNKE